MNHRWPVIVGTALLALTVLPTRLIAQTEPGSASAKATADGPFARIAILRPHDGDTLDFEAGYIRHLEFHRQARDTWSWYCWTIWVGGRQRAVVHATVWRTGA